MSLFSNSSPLKIQFKVELDWEAIFINQIESRSECAVTFQMQTQSMYTKLVS